MAYEDSPEVALEKIMRKSERALERVVSKLHSDLIKVAPVGTPESTGIKGYSGGDFKINWKLRKESPIKFYIYNPMEYASILWRGRRPFPNGRGKLQMYGSKQWYNGGDPMLAKSNIALQKQLDAIKE